MNASYPTAPKQPRRTSSGQRAPLHAAAPERRGRVKTGDRAPIGRYPKFEAAGERRRPGTRRARP